MSTTTAVLRELDQRVNDGIAVRLLWEKESGRLFIAVDDSRTQVGIEFEVPANQVEDAFQHPFAYAANIPQPTGLA